MDILRAKSIHLVGIKGVAMTALALCLQDAQIRITGSDLSEEFVTDKILRERKFEIFTGFSADHISKDIELVVFTGAHQGRKNPEVQKTMELNIPVMSHAEALGNLTNEKKLISICGTGGKSTTSAMIAWILDQTGFKPSFAIGVGNVPNFGTPGRFHPESEWFVAEADEYAVDPINDKRPRFVFQHPEIIICTNLKYDHPDIYPSFEAAQKAFLGFFNSLPDHGKLIINTDDPILKSLISKLTTKAEVISVGKTQIDSSLKLLVPGEFNQMNALMAMTVAQILGANKIKVKKAMTEFKGTMRRFEKKGNVKGADWYDDYAHTPEEIQATLETLKDLYPNKKIIAVFQPHTYSRTKALFDGFSHSFTKVDEILLLDIFASARENLDPNISSDSLGESIQKVEINKPVKNMKTIANTVKYLKDHLSMEYVVMTIGAGDVYKIYDEILKLV